MRRFFKKLSKGARDEDGAVMILAAFMFIILLGFAAIACDYAVVYYKQAQLQTAVDAAARAASRIIVDDTLSEREKEEKCKYEAGRLLELNGFPKEELKVCDIQMSDEEGVSIDAKSDVELNFARIFRDEPMEIKAGTTAITDVTVTEGEKATVDVVFVLDVSTSMYKQDGTYTGRFIPMINAVNECIDAILKENPDNRVGVVTYGGVDSTKVILNMTNRVSTVTGTYINGQWKEYYKCPTGPTYIGYYGDGRYNDKKDAVYLGTQDKDEKFSASGTYIQYGIALGSELLMNCSDDGEHRFPAVFVLTDGEATVGHKTWNAESSDTFRRNANVSSWPQIGYYTILTANYWKRNLTTEYTNRNAVLTNCMFYCLGFMMDGLTHPDMAKGVLDPAQLDVSGLGSNAREVKSYLKGTNLSCGRNPYGPDQYYYCDKYYEAATERELSEMLEDFANDVVEPTKIYSTRLTR